MSKMFQNSLKKKAKDVSLSRTPSILGCRVCFLVGFFLVFLSVKSMWSGNHGGSLVFADKNLFLF